MWNNTQLYIWRGGRRDGEVYMSPGLANHQPSKIWETTMPGHQNGKSEFEHTHENPKLENPQSNYPMVAVMHSLVTFETLVKGKQTGPYNHKSKTLRKTNQISQKQQDKEGLSIPKNALKYCKGTIRCRHHQIRDATPFSSSMACRERKPLPNIVLTLALVAGFVRVMKRQSPGMVNTL